MFVLGILTLEKLPLKEIIFNSNNSNIFHYYYLLIVLIFTVVNIIIISTESLFIFICTVILYLSTIKVVSKD